MHVGALVVHPVTVATVNGFWVATNPGPPEGIAAIFRVGVMLYLDGGHVRHQVAIIAFPIAVLALHQVHAVGIWVCGNLDVTIELRHKHFTTPVAVATGGKAVWFPVLTSFVQAVRGDIANSLARSDGTWVWPQGPAGTQAWAKTFMGSHGGLAVVEGLLLVVVIIRAVLEVVFGDRGPGSVVTSLGTAGSGTREEERVCDVTHSSTEGVPPEVFASLTVTERGGMKKVAERREGSEKQETETICVMFLCSLMAFQKRRPLKISLVRPDIHTGMSTNKMFFCSLTHDSKHKYLHLAHFSSGENYSKSDSTFP